MGYATNDGRQFGQYSINEQGAYGLFDLYLNRRRRDGHLAAPMWRSGTGEPPVALRAQPPGQLELLHRIRPDTPLRALHGDHRRGRHRLQQPDRAGDADHRLLDRSQDAPRRGGLGFDKILPAGWDFTVRFRNERRTARVFGRGTTGSVAGFAGNFEFTPEPINSTTRQLEALVGVPGKSSSSAATTAPCSITSTTAEHHGWRSGIGDLRQHGLHPLGLPPDNSHQLFLSGGYGFTPTTRGTFKLSYAKAKQDDAFPTGAAVPLFPGVGNNLQGKVDTTLAQVGSCRARYRNSLSRADYRYEDRDDKTPVVQYFTGSSTSDGFNEPRSIRTTKGVVEPAISCPARSA